jgi:predicted CXXCH cytochrome family protein
VAIPVGAQPDGGCVTDKCHTTVGTGKFVHGPVGARICTVCHNPLPNEDHKFALVAEKDELCFGCHEEKRDMVLKEFVHGPVGVGDCVACHDPHQSDFRYTLKAQAADLCFQCHEREDYSREFVHGPVGVGDCNACHNPHASEFEMQLTVAKDELCFQCHQEKAAEFNKRHVHPPVSESCTNCHDPHSEDASYLLPNAAPELCYGCHADIAEYSHAEVPHQPVSAGKCGECHLTHASDNPRLFPRAQEQLCFGCHTELGEYVSEQEHRHGPVNEGDCNACHDPHGSQNNRILRKYFPEEFYMPFAIDNYASCFQCHNSDIALDEHTKTLTDFRNGEQNLHFVHVNKEIKGRSCKACHEVHASNQAKHIRASVPFGSMNWDLPVAYTKLEDGGSCVVGCHAPKEYHRQ